MKSPIAEASKNPELYSDLMVLRSPLGYFIGTIFSPADGSTQQPGTVDSSVYWEELEDAQLAFEGNTWTQLPTPAKESEPPATA